MASMKDIKELRERTGAGVLDCKKALTEKDGDIEAAVEYLREKGVAAAAKKAGRIAAEGSVKLLINEEKNKGVIAEINSETDFAAKSEKFQALVNNLSEHILESQSENVQDLLKDTWYQDENKDFNTIIKESIASIGENINLRRFKRYTSNGFLQGYIHMNGKIGVLVDIDAEYNEQNQSIAKDIAMHIAADSPEYITREEVSDEVIAKEASIYKEQMLNEGKPEHIIDNIVEGKLEKFYGEICLIEQFFIKDTDKTVGQLLEEEKLKINGFTRFELGEGIEKRNEDFQAEVMKEMNK